MLAQGSDLSVPGDHLAILLNEDSGTASLGGTRDSAFPVNSQVRLVRSFSTFTALGTQRGGGGEE